MQLEISMTPATIFAVLFQSASSPRWFRAALTAASVSFRSRCFHDKSTCPQNSFPDWSVPRMGLLALVSYAFTSAMFSATPHAEPRPIVVDDPSCRNLVAPLIGWTTTAARRRIQ